jgi:hypothetical protein
VVASISRGAICALLAGACWHERAPRPAPAPATDPPRVTWFDDAGEELSEGNWGFVLERLPAVTSDGELVAFDERDFGNLSYSSPHNDRLVLAHRDDTVAKIVPIMSIDEGKSETMLRDDRYEGPALTVRLRAANAELAKIHAQRRFVPLQRTWHTNRDDPFTLDRFRIDWIRGRVRIANGDRVVADRDGTTWRASAPCTNEGAPGDVWLAPAQHLALVVIEFEPTTGEGPCVHPTAQTHVIAWP